MPSGSWCARAKHREDASSAAEHLYLKAGLLYPSGENPLAELKLRRVEHVERPLPPQACERGRRGAAKPMRRGREKQSEIASCAMGWWRGHRAERWTVFELLQARHAPLLMIPGVWDIELERELTIATRASPSQ